MKPISSNPSSVPPPPAGLAGTDIARDVFRGPQPCLDIAEGLYREVVGRLVDTLKAECLLAVDHHRRAQAITRLRATRLELAASIGTFLRRAEPGAD
jgi:hypothetical protein